MEIIANFNHESGTDLFSEETWNTWEFTGVSKATKKSTKYSRYDWRTNISEYNPKKDIYLIYVVYSGGDSFSDDRDAYIYVVGATHDADLAQRIQDFVKSDSKVELDGNTYPLHDIGGIKFHTYMWKGHFNKFSYIRVVKCDPLR
jgi:hypothetical protein